MPLYLLGRHATLLRSRRRRPRRDAPDSRVHLICFFTYYANLLTVYLYLLFFFTYYDSVLLRATRGPAPPSPPPAAVTYYVSVLTMLLHVLCYFTYYDSLLTRIMYCFTNAPLLTKATRGPAPPSPPPGVARRSFTRLSSMLLYLL